VILDVAEVDRAPQKHLDSPLAGCVGSLRPSFHKKAYTRNGLNWTKRFSTIALYYAFDLLWLDGKDLHKRPQVERKALLKELFDKDGIDNSVIKAKVATNSLEARPG
jgi:ATP-dependent DNA ligase